MVLKSIHALAVCSALMAGFPSQAATEGPHVLVFGGTGMMGSAIVAALTRRGIDTTVFVRPTSRVEATVKTGAHLAVGDVLDEASVVRALNARHYDAVVSAIARADNDTPVKDAVTIYATGNNNITAAAKASGVTQVIQLSNVGAGDSVGLVSPERYALSKNVYRDKSLAEDTLVGSGLAYTVIRTGALIGGESTGTAILTEDHSQRKAVRINDIATLTADCVRAPKCYRKIFHIFDPKLDVLSPSQLEEEREKLRAYKDQVRASKATGSQTGERGQPPK